MLASSPSPYSTNNQRIISIDQKVLRTRFIGRIPLQLDDSWLNLSLITGLFQGGGEPC